MSTDSIKSFGVDVLSFLKPPSLKSVGGSRLEQLKGWVPTITLIVALLGITVFFGGAVKQNEIRITQMVQKVEKNKERIIVLETTIPLYLEGFKEDLKDIKEGIEDVRVGVSHIDDNQNSTQL